MALVDATAAAFRFAALNVSALRRTAGTYIWHRAQWNSSVVSSF